MVTLWALFFSVIASSNNHQLIRRIAVFPISIEKQFESEAEDAWWRMRKRLTDDQRFLIASRNFMIQRDVYQPRAGLSAADVVILGKLLDAHAIVTTYFEDNELHMVVYDGRNSLVLWKKNLAINKNRSLSKQLLSLTERLVNDFISSVPYQTYQVIDFKYNKVVYSEDGKRFARIQRPSNYSLTIGELVEWVDVPALISRPAFSMNPQVVAQGRVVETEGETVLVQLLRQQSEKNYFNGALVRVPQMAEELYKKYALDRDRNLSPDLFLSEMVENKKDEDDSALTTALTFIGNLAIFIVLAF